MRKRIRSRGSMHLFVQPAILLCFGYFVVPDDGRHRRADVPARWRSTSSFDVPLALATSAVTAYLLGSTAGILAGGFLAARTTRHDRVAATGLLGGALLLGIVGDGGSSAPRCCCRCSR